MGEGALADYPINGLPRPVSIVSVTDVHVYMVHVKDVMKRFPITVLDSLRSIANSR